MQRVVSLTSRDAHGRPTEGGMSQAAASSGEGAVQVLTATATCFPLNVPAFFISKALTK